MHPARMSGMLLLAAILVVVANGEHTTGVDTVVAEASSVHHDGVQAPVDAAKDTSDEVVGLLTTMIQKNTELSSPSHDGKHKHVKAQVMQLLTQMIKKKRAHHKMVHKVKKHAKKMHAKKAKKAKKVKKHHKMHFKRVRNGAQLLSGLVHQNQHRAAHQEHKERAAKQRVAEKAARKAAKLEAQKPKKVDAMEAAFNQAAVEFSKRDQKELQKKKQMKKRLQQSSRVEEDEDDEDDFFENDHGPPIVESHEDLTSGPPAKLGEVGKSLVARLMTVSKSESKKHNKAAKAHKAEKHAKHAYKKASKKKPSHSKKVVLEQASAVATSHKANKVKHSHKHSHKLRHKHRQSKHAKHRHIKHKKHRAAKKIKNKLSHLDQILFNAVAANMDPKKPSEHKAKKSPKKHAKKAKRMVAVLARLSQEDEYERAVERTMANERKKKQKRKQEDADILAGRLVVHAHHQLKSDLGLSRKGEAAETKQVEDDVADASAPNDDEAAAAIAAKLLKHLDGHAMDAASLKALVNHHVDQVLAKTAHKQSLVEVHRSAHRHRRVPKHITKKHSKPRNLHKGAREIVADLKLAEKSWEEEVAQ